MPQFSLFLHFEPSAERNRASNASRSVDAIANEQQVHHVPCETNRSGPAEGVPSQHSLPYNNLAELPSRARQRQFNLLR